MEVGGEGHVFIFLDSSPLRPVATPNVEEDRFLPLVSIGKSFRSTDAPEQHERALPQQAHFNSPTRQHTIRAQRNTEKSRHAIRQ
eukprot:3559441-Prymnesium_polylepis.1